MTHRFYVEPDQIAQGRVVFSAAQGHQLRNVLRLRDGDRVRVFDGLGARDWEVELPDRIVGECPRAPEPRTRLGVYPALLQRDKFEPVLQKLTELGAHSIAPVLTARGLVRAAPEETRYVRWRSIVREASEQSGRGSVPRLLAARTLADALRCADGLRVVAYEAEREGSVRNVLAGRPRAVSVFVGPEGGFTPEEIELARANGAHVVSLGPRVLRTETASPVLAALVLHELGDLSWPTEGDCA
jgi:16S rRNA (uracil1498-N3)-methyltransferase